MREALFYDRLAGGAVACRLCPHACRITAGAAGRCGARENHDGTLFAATYGEVSSVNVDPIEKKPLYHVHPGSRILSLGSVACNLACRWCQNWQISRERPSTRPLPPAEAAALLGRHGECCGVAYTYNEPVIWIEYVLDCARLVRAAGKLNVLVTNGFVEPEPLEALLAVVDAFNIDLKGFTEAFYKDECRGALEPVKRTIRRAFEAGAEVEVTNLVIPGLNDDEPTIAAMVDFLAGISPDLPLHFSRYHPDYRCDRPATPHVTLVRAHEIAARRLRHVYLGNVNDPGRSATRCAACAEPLVARDGYAARSRLGPGGRCPACGAVLYGRFA